MIKNEVGSGGFFLPRILIKDQEAVLKKLESGELDYVDSTQWSFPEEFLCFAMQSGFLKFADNCYPNPRFKNEIPIWFLLSCQLLLRLFQSTRYQQLTYFLNAGSVLTRIGFNLSNPNNIGFNNKNTNPRKTAVCPDSVRKFFKDTKVLELRSWYNQDMQSWFKSKRAFHRRGIFILDQTHVVVPDNPNYTGAVKMPVDEHGQWYYGYSDLTEDQKKSLVHHPCYTMSVLLNIDPETQHFHIASYDWGPGNEDELVQANRILNQFCTTNPGVMKELIVDRGYIDGDLFSRAKLVWDVDIMVPLKKNMDTYKEAIGIAEREGKWEVIETIKNDDGKLIKEVSSTQVNDLEIWDNCSIPQYATVSIEKKWATDEKKFKERRWVLVSAKKSATPLAAVERYKLRTQIEERFKQLKKSWRIGEFTSPNSSLIEAQVTAIPNEKNLIIS